MFEFLRAVVATEDGNVLFMFSLIVIMEILDLITGTVGAKVNPNIVFSSKKGLEGLFKKVYGIALMLLVIPLSILMPDGVGSTLLYSVYMGYIVFLVQSLVENYEKFTGSDINVFKGFLNKIKEMANYEKDHK